MGCSPTDRTPRSPAGGAGPGALPLKISGARANGLLSPSFVKGTTEDGPALVSKYVFSALGKHPSYEVAPAFGVRLSSAALVFQRVSKSGAGCPSQSGRGQPHSKSWRGVPSRRCVPPHAKHVPSRGGEGEDFSDTL